MAGDVFGDIEWFVPPRTPDSVEDIVSHFNGTRKACEDAGRKMGIQAEMLLMQHRRQGHASIEIIGAPPTKLDTFVVLQDRNTHDHGGNSAMSIEFGWKSKNGKEVEGLHILGQVMGRAVTRYGRRR